MFEQNESREDVGSRNNNCSGKTFECIRATNSDGRTLKIDRSTSSRGESTVL